MTRRLMEAAVEFAPARRFVAREPQIEQALEPMLSAAHEGARG